MRRAASAEQRGRTRAAVQCYIQSQQPTDRSTHRPTVARNQMMLADMQFYWILASRRAGMACQCSMSPRNYALSQDIICLFRPSLFRSFNRIQFYNEVLASNTYENNEQCGEWAGKVRRTVLKQQMQAQKIYIPATNYFLYKSCLLTSWQEWQVLVP